MLSEHSISLQTRCCSIFQTSLLLSVKSAGILDPNQNMTKVLGAHRISGRMRTLARNGRYSVIWIPSRTSSLLSSSFDDSSSSPILRCNWANSIHTMAQPSTTTKAFRNHTSMDLCSTPPQSSRSEFTTLYHHSLDTGRAWDLHRRRAIPSQHLRRRHPDAVHQGFHWSGRQGRERICQGRACCHHAAAGKQVGGA